MIRVIVERVETPENEPAIFERNVFKLDGLMEDRLINGQSIHLTIGEYINGKPHEFTIKGEN